jgi:S1-C subfamily serine protease
MEETTDGQSGRVDSNGQRPDNRSPASNSASVKQKKLDGYWAWAPSGDLSEASRNTIGLGCTLARTAQGVHVISGVRKGGACDKANLRPGTMLLAINDVDLRGMRVDEVFFCQ